LDELQELRIRTYSEFDTLAFNFEMLDFEVHSNCTLDVLVERVFCEAKKHGGLLPKEAIIDGTSEECVQPCDSSNADTMFCNGPCRPTRHQ